MPGLEAQLRITAKDEAGTALDLVKKQIAALDKSIATFDKMAAAVGKIAPATDPVIKSIAASTKALEQQKIAVTALAEGIGSIDSSSAAAAGAQERLQSALADTTRMMMVQGAEAERVGHRIQAAQRKQAAAARKAREGGVGGKIAEALPFLGPGILHETAKAAEAGASLEQMKFRVRAVSGGDTTEAPFAEGLAAEVAAKYPVVTQAKALDTYLELRGNAANQNGTINQETARRNLMTVAQAQTAALAIGTEITPEDAQNLLKAVEGSGRAGDPTAVGKMFDSYIRAKQVFGSAIDSSKIRDYVQNAKGANFGIGEEQFFWQNIVRMTEGNASRLGNETAQTLQTLVGGHATKQTAKWLVSMGLASGFTPQGGGAATINGLSGSGVLQVNQLDWANQFLLPALQKHDVLSEENIKNREALLRKDNPNIDERALRERAEAGLISSAIAQSGMRTTVTDNLAHAIANQLLIERDTAQMKGASGSAALAESIGKNPVASLTELTASLSNFAAVLTDPVMPHAAAMLSSLGNAIAGAAKHYSDFAKANPEAATAVSAGALGAGGAGGGWLSWKLWTGISKFLGLRGGAAAEGAAAVPTASGAASTSPIARGGAGLLSRFGLSAAAGSPLLDVIAPLLLMREIGESANPTTPAGAKYRVDTAWPSQTWDLERSMRAEREWRADPETARGRAMMAMPAGPQTVSVNGSAQVEQTVHLDVSLDPDLRAKIDQVVSSLNFSVPLSAPTGRMDADAAPQRGGVGHM